MEKIDLKYVGAEIDATLKLMEAWNVEHPAKSRDCIPMAVIDRLKNLQKYLPFDEKDAASSKKNEKKGEP